MNKSWTITALGLIAGVAFGGLFGRWFAVAAPAGPPSAGSSAPVASPPAAASFASAPPPPVPSVLSPEAQRLEARRQLYESVDAFVQASEFEKARRLLDDDQARYGDDLAPPWHGLEQSYRLIADCLEHPSPRLRVRARAFAAVSEAVSLKSRILQACGAAP